jgi:SAM-dependent methyltransferase
MYSSGRFSREARGSEWPSDAKVEQSEQNARRRFETLADLLGQAEPGRGRRALEIGCGIGSFLNLLSRDGWGTEGLEPDPAYSRFGREKYGIPIAAIMFEHWPENPGLFDLIAAFHVLEHVLEPKQFVQKAARLLRPAGMLYLEVPCIERPYGGNLDFFFWSAHVNTFSANTLAALLRQAGFVILTYNYYSDYLWIVGTRSERPQPQEISYPCDPPREIHRRTHATRAEYLRRHAPGKKRQGLAQRVMRKIFREPWDLVPAIQRRLMRPRPGLADDPRNYRT